MTKIEFIEKYIDIPEESCDYIPWKKEMEFDLNTLIETLLTEYQALQLQQAGVIRSAFAVIPDAEKLGIGNNKITAVFKHKHQAESWAKSMWEDVYIIEQVRSEHFL